MPALMRLLATRACFISSAAGSWRARRVTLRLASASIHPSYCATSGASARAAAAPSTSAPRSSMPTINPDSSSVVTRLTVALGIHVVRAPIT